MRHIEDCEETYYEDSESLNEDADGRKRKSCIQEFTDLKWSMIRYGGRLYSCVVSPISITADAIIATVAETAMSSRDRTFL
jgi:hypothetical protein